MAQLSLLLVLLVSCFAIEELRGQQNEVETVGDAAVTETEQENESSASGELTKRGDETMTNVGYLFRGYHVLEGNPLDPDRFDPGFKTKIFKATYKEDRRTDDQRWKIPDSVDILGKESCSTSFSSETVMTESDYQRSLLAKASASASGKIKVVDASFSASAEYSRMSKTLKSNTKSVIRSEATCTVYEGRIQTGTPPEFSDNFLESVKILQDQKEYGRFLDTFGTHFVEAIEMGARFTKLQEISKEKQEKLKKQGIDIKVTASVSAAGIGSAEMARELQVSEEQTKKFEKAVETTKIVTIGSRPPSDGTQDTWIANAIENPLPTYYKLRHIVEVFEPAYFRDHKDIDYAKLKEELTKYLEGYCKTLKSSRLPDVECEGPPKGCAGGSQCSFNAICNDNPSSGDKEQQYDCKCKPGFEGDGRICQKNPKWQLGDEIEHEEEERGVWGTWGGMENCKNGVFASGFSIRAQKEGGGAFYDDTGANAVCMKCDTKNVCSKKSPWGTWSGPHNCPENSYLSGWRQNVEGQQGWASDDTSLNNVEYKCRDIETWEETDVIKGQAKEWGKWSLYVECPKGFFICGINTRVEDNTYDDTALNDIRHQCCKPLLKKKAKKKKKHHSKTE